MVDSSPLTALESDLLGDLSQDDHALHEIFEFVRLHRPGLEPPAVCRTGRELLQAWLGRRWLGLSLQNGPPPAVMQLDDLLPFIDRCGLDVIRASSQEPWLCLSDQAYVDVPWLRSGE